MLLREPSPHFKLQAFAAAATIRIRQLFQISKRFLRTLQTAALMYPDTATIALECLKEIPQHTEICNRRSSRF